MVLLLNNCIPLVNSNAFVRLVPTIRNWPMTQLIRLACPNTSKFQLHLAWHVLCFSLTRKKCCDPVQTDITTIKRLDYSLCEILLLLLKFSEVAKLDCLQEWMTLIKLVSAARLLEHQGPHTKMQFLRVGSIIFLLRVVNRVPVHTSLLLKLDVPNTQ